MNPIKANPSQTVGEMPNRAFEAPIPGQSLTRQPGIYPFEHPPEFADAEDAFQALMSSIRMPNTAEQLLDLMELGVPVKGIVQTLIMVGFSEGKWTPDVGLLLIQPATALLMYMAKEAGIKPVTGLKPKKSETLDLVIEKRLKQMEEQETSDNNSGFMKKPEGK